MKIVFSGVMPPVLGTPASSNEIPDKQLGRREEGRTGADSALGRSIDGRGKERREGPFGRSFVPRAPSVRASVLVQSNHL